jgi:hypothetical protein
VARALAHVTSYQVTIAATTNGRPRTGRPRSGAFPTPRAGQRGGRGGFGFRPGTQTLTAVRKSGGFEDYIVSRGKDFSGKTVTSQQIVYGSKMCSKTGSARSYTCRTMSGQFNFNPDPTVAFEQGAGGTTFKTTGSKRIGGQVCDGYTYSNRSQTVTASGSVYIARSTHLPCEQIAAITRRFNGRSFTQHSTDVWSHFNDQSLKVPAIPSA